VEFRLLGAVEVRTSQGPLALGPPQRRTVLAALLVDVGRPVPPATIMERVWDEPPPGARRALHAHVARLRHALAGAEEGAPLALRPGGYVLDVPADWVDLHRFRRLIAAARDPGRCGQECCKLLEDALGMWRGAPLGEVPGSWVERVRQGLVCQRIDAAVLLCQTLLQIGDHTRVVDVARELLVDYPLAEPLYAALMTALVAADRPAEALDYYPIAQAALRHALGVEPGPELTRLHAAILRGDPAPLSVGATVPPSMPRAMPTRLARGPRPSMPIPAQLPSDVASFTGRVEQLEWLDRLLAGGADASATAVTIAVITGSAGVGKTALAVHWAHRVAARFPDGQLYVNLRGYDPDQPLPAADALAQLLTGLGVPAQDIPLGLDERAGRYRTALAGRRMLILLDNAGSDEQIRPLLPGAAFCMVLVTSRDALAGLVATHGARRVELDRLPEDDAVELLRRLIGIRVDGDPAAAAALASLCARLPLALRIAAELAVARPRLSLPSLVDDLNDEHRRLDLLTVRGDSRAAIQAVFSWSLRHLPAEAARGFALLGLHPGPDLDDHGAAALIGGALDDARWVLDMLARAHLVEPGAANRYAMHDLLRIFALRLASTSESADVRTAALGRLFDYYLATAAEAMDRLYPAEAHRRPPRSTATTPMPVLTDQDAARAWLESERPAMVAAAGHAVRHGSPAYAVRLSATLFRYLAGGHYAAALALHGYARDGAVQTGDLAGQAQALLGLGAAHMRLGRYHAAADHHRQALDLYRRAGDPAGEARALNNLGNVEDRLGQRDEASAHLRQALALYRKLGDQIGQARALNNLGAFEERVGDYRSAARHHEQALALVRDAGDRSDGAAAHSNLCDVEIRLGHYQRAARHGLRALLLYRQVGNRTGEAWTLDSMGTVFTRLARPSIAIEYHEDALTLFGEAGDRDGEAWALNGLGEAANAKQQPTNALARHRAALTIATETGARAQQARAHAGLGTACRALGDVERAGNHLRQALSLYTSLGMPEADIIRERLAAGSP
jgi:DNA-binding SARP family transcriptional activator/Flp pilus assembly protein TadD